MAGDKLYLRRSFLNRNTSQLEWALLLQNQKRNLNDAPTQSLWENVSLSDCKIVAHVRQRGDDGFICHHLQVHQGVIQHCDAKTGISLFIQVAMCLSNITCCLDALCYYFIAHEVRSSKDTFRLTVIQRRATFSTSEVWTWDEDGSNILCPLEERSGLWAEHFNGKRAECRFQYEATRWKVRAGKETGQRWVSINHRIKMSNTVQGFVPVTGSLSAPLYSILQCRMQKKKS